MLKCGSDANGGAQTLIECIYSAAESGYEALVKFLLEYDADPIFKTSKHNILPMLLRKSLIMSRCAVTAVTLDYWGRIVGWKGYIDETKLSSNGNTALLSAANKNHIEAIRLLLDHGADPSLQNNDGLTAFDLASTLECKAMFKDPAASLPSGQLDVR